MSVYVDGIFNIYTCTKCAWMAFTRDVHEGTTPFMIQCEAKGCDGFAQSSMYRIPDQFQADVEKRLTHEWYRPMSTSERKQLKNPAIRQHVEMGGLLLRKLAVN